MPGPIRLTANDAPLLLEVTHGGGQTATIRVEPNEVLFDEDRVIRLLSLHLPGGVENYVLLPRSHTADQVLAAVGDWLVPFGLSLAGSKIVQGKRFVESLTKWLLFSKLASGTIRDLCERVRAANCGYFYTDGRLVFERPIYVPA